METSGLPRSAVVLSAIAVLAAAASLLGPAAAPAPSAEATMSEKAPAPRQRSGGFEAGEPFPEILLPSLQDGTPTSLAAFRGEKVILHVFASW